MQLVGGTHARALQSHGDWLDIHQVLPCQVTLGCYGRLGNQLLSAFCASHAAHTLRTKLRLGGGGGCYGGLVNVR